MIVALSYFIGVVGAVVQLLYSTCYLLVVRYINQLRQLLSLCVPFWCEQHLCEYL